MTVPGYFPLGQLRGIVPQKKNWNPELEDVISIILSIKKSSFCNNFHWHLCNLQAIPDQSECLVVERSCLNVFKRSKFENQCLPGRLSFHHHFTIKNLSTSDEFKHCFINSGTSKCFIYPLHQISGTQSVAIAS